MEKLFHLLVMFLWGVGARTGKVVEWKTSEKEMSAVGDPGMKRDGLRVAFEAWNFCNEVAYEAPGMASPRAADCFDIANSTLIDKVSKADNIPEIGKSFKGLNVDALRSPDLYAVEKELYLGSLYEVSENSKPWQILVLKTGIHTLSLLWRRVHESAHFESSNDTTLR